MTRKIKKLKKQFKRLEELEEIKKDIKIQQNQKTEDLKKLFIEAYGSLENTPAIQLKYLED